MSLLFCARSPRKPRCVPEKHNLRSFSNLRTNEKWWMSDVSSAFMFDSHLRGSTACGNWRTAKLIFELDSLVSLRLGKYHEVRNILKPIFLWSSFKKLEKNPITLAKALEEGTVEICWQATCGAQVGTTFFHPRIGKATKKSTKENFEGEVDPTHSL